MGGRVGLESGHFAPSEDFVVGDDFDEDFVGHPVSFQGGDAKVGSLVFHLGGGIGFLTNGILE